MKHILIFDNKKLKIIFKKINYYKLSFKNGVFLLIAPYSFDKDKIERIIKKHRRWFKNRIIEYNTFHQKKKYLKFIHRSESEFESIVLNLLIEGSRKMGVKFGEIKFKYLKSRWGSCSLKGKITINLYLRLFPYRLIEYVVYHELAHLKHHNHGKEFKNFLSKFIYDWKDRRNELKLWGNLLKESYHLS